MTLEKNKGEIGSTEPGSTEPGFVPAPDTGLRDAGLRDTGLRDASAETDTSAAPKDADPKDANPGKVPQSVDKASDSESPVLISLDDWNHKCSRSGSVFESFYHAFNGVKVALAQRNLRIHFCATPVVLALAWFLQVEAWGYALLIFSIGLVIVSEFLNTAIEHMVDIQANYRYHLSARYAKDTAAAAVMFSALTAVAVAAFVFVPKIWQLLSR